MRNNFSIVLLFLSALLSSGTIGGCRGAELDVRPATVAGQFYPADPARLKLAVQSFMADAISASTGKPIGIVVPHAGYIFSGQIAADAYRQAAGQSYDVVVILGTNHTTPDFTGISIRSRGAYRTPLGNAEIEEAVAAQLLAQDSDCSKTQAPQAREHSVEVQVPFIQVLFPQAKIVPVVIGEPDLAMCTHFGQILARVLKGRKALLVASSDLSHYPTQQDAFRVDRQTLEAIGKLDPQAFESTTRSLMKSQVSSLATCACGAAPIMAIMTAAKSLGASRAVVISYANSGDTTMGEPIRAVGYGAVALTSGEGASNLKPFDRTPSPASFSPLQAADKKTLLKIARDTVRRYLTTDTVPLVRGVVSRLEFPQGAFVTLRMHGDLRGCIGHMAEDMPLARAVSSMALQAAFNDSRFNPLQPSELENVEIEISALTPIKQIRGPEEIVVGRDGVVLQKDGRSAVFLPQVAPENKWGRDEMLENLCRKAGLPPESWKKGARFFAFQAEVFGESQFR